MRRRSHSALGRMESSEENESVITVTEPQTWTLIVSSVAMMLGVITIVSTLFVRVIRAEIGGVRAEIGGAIGEVRAEIGGLRSEIGAVNTRIDGLDRDVQALVKHTFGLGRG